MLHILHPLLILLRLRKKYWKDFSIFPHDRLGGALCLLVIMMWVKLQQDDDYALINHHSLSRNKEGFLLNRPLTTQLPFSVFNLAITEEELYCPLGHSLQSTPFGNHTYEKSHSLSILRIQAHSFVTDEWRHWPLVQNGSDSVIEHIFALPLYKHCLKYGRLSPVLIYLILNDAGDLRALTISIRFQK